MKRMLLAGLMVGGVAVAGAAGVGGQAAAVESGCSTMPPGAAAFEFAGRYSTDPVAGSVETRAENVAYEGSTMWVMNIGSIDVVNIANPANPVKTTTLPLPGEPTSVAVSGGLVAVSVPATSKTNNGVVVLFRGTTKVGQVTVGALPDMVTFTPDGKLLAVANEGEPNSYGLPGSVDPEGSISVITTQPFRTRGAPKFIAAQPVATISFADFNEGGARHSELTSDVRIFGPGASVAQDLEPEYITIADDNRTAWVSLQENNALAHVDLRSKTVTRISGLGFADHNVEGNGIDASDQNGGVIDIATWPVMGMYMPDGIASFRSGDEYYVLTANEGDARDWPGINAAGDEASRARSVADLDLFPDAASNNSLGRLNVSTQYPTTRNEAGKFTSLYSFGSRSFSIRAADGSMVWDSGDAFECITEELVAANFNASNTNNTKKNRSDDKGPEPEIVVVGAVGDRQLAFIGLERVGGVVVYDVTDPEAPIFQQYLKTRDFAVAAGPDSGPEGLVFVPAANSPTGTPMVLVGNEVTGTVAIFQLTSG